MIDKKEMTASNVSVGADTEQSIQKCTDISINDNDENIKYFEEMQRELMLSLDPSYLKTISMSELYDTVYQSKPPLIDGLLYPGTYIFAGAPKLGKSFFMAQLAYHISTGNGAETLPLSFTILTALEKTASFSASLTSLVIDIFGTLPNNSSILISNISASLGIKLISGQHCADSHLDTD